MNHDEFKTNKLYVSEVIRLRKLGYSNTRIYYEMKSKYPEIGRFNINELLHELGYIKGYKYGGYRSGSGKGNKYIYDEIIFDSEGELVFYLYEKSRGVTPIKCMDSFQLKNANYTPDFLIGDTYYEIKSINNYDYWGWNFDKLEGFPHKLVVICNDELLKMRDELGIDTLYLSKYLRS